MYISVGETHKTLASENIMRKIKMDGYRATMLAEGEIKESYEGERIVAWQYLHDSRLAYTLQGWFSRQCKGLIQAGIIKK